MAKAILTAILEGQVEGLADTEDMEHDGADDDNDGSLGGGRGRCASHAGTCASHAGTCAVSPRPSTPPAFSLARCSAW